MEITAFPTGRVEMERLELDLSQVSAEAALDALDRAADDAHHVYYDFLRACHDAEMTIRNTGSIYGNAKPVQIDITGSGSLCRACMGAGVTPVYNADADRVVFNSCQSCGGTCLSGPVILPERR